MSGKDEMIKATIRRNAELKKRKERTHPSSLDDKGRLKDDFMKVKAVKHDRSRLKAGKTYDVTKVMGENLIKKEFATAVK